MSVFGLAGRVKQKAQRELGPFLRAPKATRSLYLAFTEILLDGDLGPANSSALVVANHSCDWDLRVAHHITTHCGHEFSVFANPTDLERDPQLAELGLIGVPRNDAVAASKTLREQGRRLQESSGQALWVFPQGGYFRIEQSTVEAGALGVRLYAPGATFTCVAIHYEFFGPRRPWVWVKAVTMPAPEPRNPAKLQAALSQVYQELRNDIVTGGGNYRPVLHPASQSVSLRGVPVNLRVINEFLELDPETRGSAMVHDGRTLRLLPGPRGVTPQAALTALAATLGRDLAQTVITHLEVETHAGSHH